MAYCTAAEVESFLGLDFTTTSRPTETQVTSFCAQAQDEQIDPFIESVALPITDTKGLNLLKGVSRYWVAAQVLLLDPETQALGEVYMREFRDRMQAINHNLNMLTADTGKPAPTGADRPTADFERGVSAW